MTKGDILGNSLTGAHFSCNSHGNIPFPAGKECPSLHPPPRAELTPAISQRCSQPSPRDWGSARRYYKPCAQVHVERRSLPQPGIVPSHRQWSLFVLQNSISHMECPQPEPAASGGVFSIPISVLWGWCKAGAAGAHGAVVGRDRRGHSPTSVSDSLSFPTLGVTSWKLLREESREWGQHARQRSSAARTKGITLWPVTPVWRQLVLLEKKRRKGN